MERIEIWSKPAFQGISGHEHLFIVYTNFVGAQFYIRGGPEYLLGNGSAGGGFVLGNITTSYGKYVEGTIDWIPIEDRVNYPSVIIAVGDNLLSDYHSMINKAQLIDDARIPYDAFEQNSNSVVYEVVERAGLEPKLPPGIDNTGPTAWSHDAPAANTEALDDELDEFARTGDVKCFAAGTLIELADGTRKPIERIAVGDSVLAFDDEAQAGRGALVSRRVTQLFATPDRAVLDFHGLRVTPGHVFLCGDGPQAGSFRMLLDILCDDGAIVDREGRLVRAATNGLVGTREDASVEIAYVTEPDSRAWRRARLRAGTRLCLPEGGSTTVLACLQDEGYRLRSDGLVECDGEAPQPLPWFGVPPRPEDYVLARSGLTLAELYAEAPQRPIPTWPTGARSDVGRAESREPLGDPEVGEGAGAALHFARRAGETLQ